MRDSLKKYTDRELLEGIRDSSSEVLNYIYNQFYPMIYKHIITNHGNKEEARDIFQEGVIALYEKSKNTGFELTSTLSTYLFSICRNLWLNKLNRQKSRENLQGDMPEQSEQIDFLNEEATESQHIIQQLLRKIGEGCRQLFLKIFYEEKNNKEIAEELGLSGADYVKTQKYRCLQQLRKLYTEMNH